MRFKVVMALALALVLLFTVATPALAAAPVKGSFARIAPETADVAKYSLQATHDNNVKVTIVIRGATPSTIYRVLLFYGTVTPGNSVALDYVMTDERGNLRYVTKEPDWSPGMINFQLKLLSPSYVYPTDLAFVGQIETLTFK